MSGDAATGKTTVIKQLGRLHQLRIRPRFPAARERIPVIYITLPAHCTSDPTEAATSWCQVF